MKPTLRLELQQVPPDEPQDDWLGPMTDAVMTQETLDGRDKVGKYCDVCHSWECECAVGEYCPHCEHSPCCQPKICNDTKAFESTGAMGACLGFEWSCGTCKDQKVIMTKLAGHGHADDLAEYEPCHDCMGRM